MSTPEIQEQILESSPLPSPETDAGATPAAEAENSPSPTLQIILPGETTAEPQQTQSVPEAGEGDTAGAAEDVSLQTLVTAEPTATPEPLPAPDGGGSIIWIVAAALVILVIALVLILRSVKRKKEESEMGKYPTPSTRIPERRRGNMQSTMKTETVEEDFAAASRYRVGYAQIMGGRENQEDSYCISNWKDPRVLAERGLLAAVADGIGGMSNGQVASGTVVRNMCARFERQNVNMAMSDRLLELAAQSQQDVLSIVQRGGNCGTTLVSVLIKDGYMVTLSVGDSRICLYRSGMLLQLNREHVLGKESDEYSMLHHTAQNIDAHKRKAITAYLGKPNLRLIDRTLNPMKLVSGDRLLLMSDGVFGSLSDDEIIACMQLPPDKAAQAVIQAVDTKHLPHQDNATIVIVEME